MTETVEIRRVEQTIINKGTKYKELYKFFDKMTYLSKNLWNTTNYKMLEIFKENGGDANKIPSFFDMATLCCREHGGNDTLGNTVSTYIVKDCVGTWTSYSKIVKEFDKDPEKFCKVRGYDTSVLEKKRDDGSYVCRPSVPKFLDKEKGRRTLPLSSRVVQLVDGSLVCTNKKINTIYKELTGEEQFVYEPSRYEHYCEEFGAENVKFAMLRIVPKIGQYFCAEVIYTITVPKVQTVKDNKYLKKEERELKTNEVAPERTVSVKMGFKDFATLTNNFGAKFMSFSSEPMMSVIDEYVDKRAKIQEILTTVNSTEEQPVYSSKRLQRLAFKFTRQTKYMANMYSKYIVDWCVQMGVSEVLIGKSKGQKSGMSGNYSLLPSVIFEDQLKYKLEEKGISVQNVSLANTSYTSFIDLEPLTKKNSKKERVVDGVFTSPNGVKYKASVNASLNIIRARYKSAFTESNVNEVDLDCDMYTIEKTPTLEIVKK